LNKIPYEERREVYMKAIARNANTQIVVAIEEMSEVIKALTKWLRWNVAEQTVAQVYNEAPKYFASIIEEVADATIMLEQLRLIFGINEEVCEAMDAKIERLKERVSDGTV
jgi:hypothetical protein